MFGNHAGISTLDFAPMSFRAWLTVFRVPSVFSAMSNIHAGYFIAGGPFWSWKLHAGFVSSSLLIMAGMALNDAADKDVDAAERPERPIPWGAVSETSARRAAIIFMVF